MNSTPFKRPANRPSPTAAERCVVWLVSIGLVLAGTGTPWTARAQVSGEVRAEFDAAFDRLDAVLAAAEVGLDPSLADLEELAFDLAFEEPDAIARWVRENVAFEPYLGLLRGPEGTLAARGGNALDQAVLLATLLNDAGYQAEVARTTLDVATAEILIDAMDPVAAQELRRQSDGPRAMGPAALAAELDLDARELERLRDESAADLESMAAEAERVAASLRARVQEAGVDLRDGNLRDRLVQEAQDYFFVRWRVSGADAWTHAHPAFAEDSDALAGLEIDETFADSVPDALQHRVRIQLFVEQKRGDTLDARPVTDAWERPAANLLRQPLRIASLADGFSDVDDIDDLDAARQATTFFMPRVADRPAPGAMAFDLNGNVVPATAAASDAAGIFQTVGGAVGGAAGALGALGGDADAADPDDFLALSGHWIEYTLIAPGGVETTHRRMLVDRIGAEARAAGSTDLRPMDEADVFAAVQEAHVVMVSTGAMSEDYLSWHLIQAQKRANELLRDVVAAMLEGGSSPAPSSELAQIEATVGYLLLHGMFDGYRPDGALRIQAAPRVTVLSRSLDGSTARSDIVTDDERVVGAGGAPRLEDAVASGVWRTMVESMPLRNGADRIQDVFASLQAAERQGIGTVVLAPGETHRVDEIRVPEDSRAAIRADLEAGYAVIAPVAPPEAVPEPAWWRVDPATGATLGRGGDGRGQTLLEYFATEISIGVTVAFALYGQHQCDQIEDPRAAGCCMVQNVALAGFGVGLGAALTGVWSTLQVIVVIDGGYNIAGAIGLFDACSVLMDLDRRDAEIAGA